MAQEAWTPLEIISRALATGRLAHAYIFSGKSVRDREKLLTHAAQLLLCKKPLSSSSNILEPCQGCTSCVKAVKAIHPDMLEIRPIGNSIRIDQIKTLQEQVKFAPLEADRRVIAIYEADTLNIASANALLKLLEEPPGDNVILLSVATPSNLLPTIVSRCQVLRLSEKTDSDFKRHKLLEGLSEDTKTFVNYIIRNIVADGPEELRSLLEIRERLAKFLEKGQDALTMLALSTFLSSSKQRLQQALTILRLFLRDIFLLKKNSNNPERAKGLLINPDFVLVLTQLADRINYDTLEAYEGVLAKAEVMLERNVRPEMVADKMLIFWFKLAPQDVPDR